MFLVAQISNKVGMMQDRYFFRLLIFLIFPLLIHTQSAVTHLDQKDWDGRLGDKLIMYVKAKWVAYHYKLPFLYRPFAYSDQLKMHVREEHLSDSVAKDYEKKVRCSDPSEIERFRHEGEDVLYEVHYDFAFPQWQCSQNKKYGSLEIMDWPEVYSNKEFIDELRKNIAPRNPVECCNIPAHKIGVAVHIRTGGGFDYPLLSRQLYTLKELDPGEKSSRRLHVDKQFPLKFPPLQYYVDQVKRLSEMHHNVWMFVYIYTDSKDPVSIMNSIEAGVNKKNITFDCRRKDNHHAKNVLEDMFAMTQYECLIRSASNYPQISQLLGNHRIVIYPKSCKWIGNTMVIDEVGTFIRK